MTAEHRSDVSVLTLEHTFGRMRTASKSGGTLPRPDRPNRPNRMEGFMEPINFRTPSRWNSVPVPPRVAERAFDRADKQDDGCWISRYSVASHGYSQVGWQDNGKRHVVLGHRAAWTHVNGQVPLGMTLDHVCSNRRCVNPSHLRLLPNFENARRINGMDWPIGACANGHPSNHLRELFGKTNKSGMPRKGLGCATCYTIYQRRYDWRTQNPGEPFPDDLKLQSERVLGLPDSGEGDRG